MFLIVSLVKQGLKRNTDINNTTNVITIGNKSNAYAMPSTPSVVKPFEKATICSDTTSNSSLRIIPSYMLRVLFSYGCTV